MRLPWPPTASAWWTSQDAAYQLTSRAKPQAKVDLRLATGRAAEGGRAVSGRQRQRRRPTLAVLLDLGPRPWCDRSVVETAGRQAAGCTGRGTAAQAASAGLQGGLGVQQLSQVEVWFLPGRKRQAASKPRGRQRHRWRQQSCRSTLGPPCSSRCPADWPWCRAACVCRVLPCSGACRPAAATFAWPPLRVACLAAPPLFHPAHETALVVHIINLPWISSCAVSLLQGAACLPAPTLVPNDGWGSACSQGASTAEHRPPRCCLPLTGPPQVLGWAPGSAAPDTPAFRFSPLAALAAGRGGSAGGCRPHAGLQQPATLAARRDAA